ncbi:MAG: hypothetical protein ACT4P7_22740 [Gemmatimonadaceae bacterium]
MLGIEKQGLQVFRRVRDYLAQSAPPVSYGDVTRLVDQLNGVITRLEGYAREQGARSSQALVATRRKRAMAVSIRREFIRPIARAARALFARDDALLAAFPMPAVRDYEGTIAAAESMAQTATDHRQRFVDAGFPNDFVERMQKSAVDLRAGIDAHAQEFGKRSASTAGLRQEYLRGRDLVRVLDAMVAPRLAATPDRLAEWRTISRFERQPVAGVTPEIPPAGSNGGSAAPVGAAPVSSSGRVVSGSDAVRSTQLMAKEDVQTA